MALALTFVKLKSAFAGAETMNSSNDSAKLLSLVNLKSLPTRSIFKALIRRPIFKSLAAFMFVNAEPSTRSSGADEMKSRRNLSGTRGLQCHFTFLSCAMNIICHKNSELHSSRPR